MNYTTEQKKENVRKIRDYLASNSPPPEFNMREYVRTKKQGSASSYLLTVPTDLSIYNECGTTACFAGHGPLAGIAPLENEAWLDYTDRCFVPREEPAASFWLFASAWEGYLSQSTADAAVERADTYLKSGVPEDFEGVYSWMEG